MHQLGLLESSVYGQKSRFCYNWLFVSAKRRGAEYTNLSPGEDPYRPGALEPSDVLLMPRPDTPSGTVSNSSLFRLTCEVDCRSRSAVVAGGALSVSPRSEVPGTGCDLCASALMLRLHLASMVNRGLRGAFACPGSGWTTSIWEPLGPGGWAEPVPAA